MNETGRIVSLAVASLMESGVPHPHRHIFVGASGRIATLVMSRSPLTPEDLATLRKVCSEYGYRIVMEPDGESPRSEVLTAILSAKDRQALVRYTSTLDLDLTPPTDDSPFFFQLAASPSASTSAALFG